MEKRRKYQEKQLIEETADQTLDTLNLQIDNNKEHYYLKRIQKLTERNRNGNPN